MPDSVERLLGDIKGHIGEINGRLIGIEKQIQDSWDQRRRLYEEVGAVKLSVSKLSVIERDIESIQKTIDQEIRPHIEDYRRMKNRGLGIVTAVGALGGVAGFGLDKLLHWWRG